jgi:hypothetical protein
MTLEEYGGTDLNPRDETEVLSIKDKNFKETKKMLQIFINTFQDNELPLSENSYQIGSYHFLEFIEDNYPNNVLGIHKGSSIKEKIDLTSSKIKIYNDISIIKTYFDRQIAEFEGSMNLECVKSLEKDAENQIKRICKEILMISKYFQLIIFKHQRVFSSTILENTDLLIGHVLRELKAEFEGDISAAKLKLKKLIQNSATTDPFLISFAFSV